MGQLHERLGLLFGVLLSLRRVVGSQQKHCEAAGRSRESEQVLDALHTAILCAMTDRRAYRTVRSVPAVALPGWLGPVPAAHTDRLYRFIRCREQSTVRVTRTSDRVGVQTNSTALRYTR